MTLEKYFSELIETRIELTNDEIAKEPWYQELQDKLIAAQKKITPENMQAFIECNMIIAEINERTAKTQYSKAFIDGMEAAKLLTPILTPKE